ncbi:MAG TPA: molybdopterin oxidoreductase family protein [Opitutaceae bacterium]|nr:molybdopterin oxidoreductase family protein [Opitutaceae bacterium]
MKSKLKKFLRANLRASQGPMTSELVLHPTQFGLGHVPARLKPVGTTTTVCGFCSTGCSLKVHLNESGEAINLTANPDYSVNLGMACPKGWEALTPLAAKDRATEPLLRNAEGALEAVSWPRAIEAFAEKFKGIQERHGKEALAFLSTGQIVMEEMALLGALAKFGMGMLHVDSNTRQCMATSHVAYKQSFGFDAPPFCYDDFEESDALIFIGANPCIAHPIMWQRVMMNRRNPEIVVFDPRRTETAMAATLHVPLRPKSDLTVLYGLAYLLIEYGAVKQDFVEHHCSGYAEFAEFVKTFTPEFVARESGLSVDLLRKVARIIATKERVSFWWTMGVNQGHESTRTAQAIINLALMTGNIGRPGTGANSITGQCNAMGSRLFGNATSLLGGYDFLKEAHRAHVAKVLGIDAAVIPDRVGMAYDQIIDAIERGEIKGLWIIATNTAHSWINQNRFQEIRKKLDFLVVQDMYVTTETAQLADLILPAAGWGEKEGVFINSERRLGLARKVSRAPGQALSDFAIFKLLAEAWGCGEQFRAWKDPAATFQILKELSRGQPCDFTGIKDYADIEAEGGIQWPWTEREALLRKKAKGRMQNGDGTAGVLDGKDGHADVAAPLDQKEEYRFQNGGTPSSDSVPQGESGMPNVHPTEPPSDHSAFCLHPSSLGGRLGRRKGRRLFEDGKFYTPDGRARFVFDMPRSMPEQPDGKYPFLLLTGRGSSAQWHTGSRTNKSDVLRKLAPRELYVEINPTDADRLKIKSGERVVVFSRRGAAEAVAQITQTVQPMQVFMPMHFDAVNRLTFPAFDPHSRQPSYKACAVAVRKGEG